MYHFEKQFQILSAVVQNERVKRLLPTFAQNGCVEHSGWCSTRERVGEVLPGSDEGDPIDPQARERWRFGEKPADLLRMTS